MMTEKQLMDLKVKVDAAKTKIAELRGKKMSVMDSLKRDWKCATLKQAKEKTKKYQDTISDLEDKKQDAIDELHKNYNL